MLQLAQGSPPPPPMDPPPDLLTTLGASRTASAELCRFCSRTSSECCRFWAKGFSTARWPAPVPLLSGGATWSASVSQSSSDIPATGSGVLSLPASGPPEPNFFQIGTTEQKVPARTASAACNLEWRVPSLPPSKLLQVREHACRRRTFASASASARPLHHSHLHTRGACHPPSSTRTPDRRAAARRRSGSPSNAACRAGSCAAAPPHRCHATTALPRHHRAATAPARRRHEATAPPPPRHHAAAATTPPRRRATAPPRHRATAPPRHRAN